jgi:hypothetical protein
MIFLKASLLLYITAVEKFIHLLPCNNKLNFENDIPSSDGISFCRECSNLQYNSEDKHQNQD